MLQGKCHLPMSPRLTHFSSSSCSTLLVRMWMPANERCADGKWQGCKLSASTLMHNILSQSAADEFINIRHNKFKNMVTRTFLRCLCFLSSFWIPPSTSPPPPPLQLLNQLNAHRGLTAHSPVEKNTCNKSLLCAVPLCDGKAAIFNYGLHPHPSSRWIDVGCRYRQPLALHQVFVFCVERAVKRRWCWWRVDQHHRVGNNWSQDGNLDIRVFLEKEMKRRKWNYVVV